MIYQAIGLSTKRVYATGSRADCARKLLAGYPNKNTAKIGNTVKRPKVFPEAIKIVRRRAHEIS